MTDPTSEVAERGPNPVQQLRWAVQDSLVMTRRNLLRYVRLPENLMGITLQPIMFLVLFTYVLGGAIRATTDDYITFLLPGILVQSMVFGSMFTALGLAQDVQSGLFDRYRSLPMSRSAVVTGRLTADMLGNVLVATIMVSVGMLMGFRFGGGLLESLASPAIAILFALPVAGVFAGIGLLVRTVESVNVGGFMVMFPLTFISSAFVPVETMPGWLQPTAEANPFTKVVNTARALALGQEAGDLTITLVWIVVLTLIAVPLAVMAYNRN